MSVLCPFCESELRHVKVSKLPGKKGGVAADMKCTVFSCPSCKKAITVTADAEQHRETVEALQRMGAELDSIRKRLPK